jgi:uncharacterized DUF497 family protein
MQFEWEERKAAGNLSKHGVSFEEAATIFGDPLSDTFDDPSHSAEERRFITIGLSEKGRMLLVAHTDEGETIRIISARESRLAEKKSFMKKVKTEMEEDGLLPEYDLSQLKGRTRGKYVERYHAGTRLVLLEPDVAAAFPDAKAVNEALRLLIKVAQTQTSSRC